MKITYKCEHFDLYDKEEKRPTTTVMLESRSEILHDVIEDFEQFLKGCGFSSKLKLELSYEDELDNE